MQIYLIRAQEIYLYKVGITKDIKQRLKQLQTGCPYQLEVIDMYEPKEFVSKIEKMLHRRFSCYQTKDFSKIQGEWFDLPNDTVLNFKKINAK